MTMEEDIKITSELATLISALLDEKLSDNKRRAFPMPDIFKCLEKEIKAAYPDTDRYKFQKALSTATKSGKLKGYEIKLGKNGGIGRVDYIKPGTVEAAPVIVTLPAVKESSSIEFNGKPYKVSFSKENLERLFTKVFKVREDVSGDIVFDDRHFSPDEPSAIEYIDNFLFYFNESDNDDYQGADNDDYQGADND